MAIQSRAYHEEEDFERVRGLLIESYALTGRIHNWWLDRWEVCRYGGYAQDELAGRQPWAEHVRLWETERGKLVGAVNPEGRDCFFLQIHPDYRHLEEEMLAWAQAHHLARHPQAADRPPLDTFAYEYDQERTELLANLGFQDQGRCEYTRRCDLGRPIPAGPLPPGYTIRPVDRQEPGDLEKWAEVANQAFASESNTAEAAGVLSRAPTYRPDLDLVAVAPDGSFAAFCVVWFGPDNRLGWFEPVGTHPQHRRRGLAKAVLCQGLQRLEELGATAVHVGSGYDSPANHLYQSVGFDTYEIWHHYRWAGS